MTTYVNGQPVENSTILAGEMIVHVLPDENVVTINSADIFREPQRPQPRQHPSNPDWEPDKPHLHIVPDITNR